MHKDATVVQFEDLMNERDFELKFGRKMTPEERSLLSLSDKFLHGPDTADSASNLLDFRPRLQSKSSRKRAA